MKAPAEGSEDAFGGQLSRARPQDRRIGDIFARALASSHITLCLKALETLSFLLAHFGQQADHETRHGAKFGRLRPDAGAPPPMCREVETPPRPTRALGGGTSPQKLGIFGDDRV